MMSDNAPIEVAVSPPTSPRSDYYKDDDDNNKKNKKTATTTKKKEEEVGGTENAKDDDDEEAVFYSTKQQEEHEPETQELIPPPPPVDLQFIDHFSLRQPSSTVRYRNKQVQIYDLVNDQLQLEHQMMISPPKEPENENNNSKNKKSTSNTSTSTKTPTKTTTLQITMHRMRSGSIGLRLLRLIYTLVALLLFAFTLIFAAQAIAFQAMEIPKHTGKAAGQQLRVDVMIATCLSLPLMGYSMASLIVMAMTFVIDCWNGHVFYALLFSGLFKGNNASNNIVLVEWFSFVFYIGIPTIVLVVTNFMKIENWQEITYLTWYLSMSFSFLCFCLLIFYNEIKLCLVCTRHQFPNLKGSTALITKAILTTCIQSYCAVQEHTYLVQSDQDGNHNIQNFLTVENAISSYITPYGRVKCRFMKCCYEKLDPPQRRFSIEEMRESVPYVTNRAGWSLERMCCKLRLGRNRFVVSGPNALGKNQYRSTLICNFLGFLLSTLSIISIAYGKGQGTFYLLVLGILLLVIIGVPLLHSAQQLVQAMPPEDYASLLTVGGGGEQQQQQQQQGDGPDAATDNDGSTAPAFYQAWAAFTVAKPKECYCWLRFGISVVLFFLWPMISLYISNLYKAATLFLITGVFSGFRLYLDAGSMICEQGSLSDIQFNNNNNLDNNINSASDNNQNQNETDLADQKAKEMTDHARAAEIMGKITNSPRTGLWYLLFLGVGAYFVWSGATSLNGEDATPQDGRETIVFVDDFYYPPQPDISYTTCELHKAYAIPGQDVTYMMDYNLLAGLGYETTNVTQHVMEKWFGPNEWVDETEFVLQWKKDRGYELSPVSFKLFSKTNMPGVGVLSIRGTETPTDRLFNALLYSSSFLTHFARLLMPFSWIWADIYDELIATTSWTASDQLQRIGYYQETTHFANDLLRNNYTFQGKNYTWLRTTGVSLGGGLALITGAQSDAYGIGIAGMNPVDARRTFHPPLEMDAINTQVLNVIPENDFISNMGTKVRNFDTIGCRTWPAKRYNCHSFWRIYCEYLYSCGTPPGKPAYCICVAIWGYPEPLPKEGANRTFAEACKEGDAEFRLAVGQESDSSWLENL